MTNLYLIDYWVPFPASEYGGLVAVIATSDEECFDILKTASENGQFDDQYVDRIMEKVKLAQKFLLAFDFQTGIVETFTT